MVLEYLSEGMEEKEAVISIYDDNKMFLTKVVGFVTVASARLTSDIFSSNDLAAKRTGETLIIRLTERYNFKTGFITLSLEKDNTAYSIHSAIPVSNALTLYAYRYGGKWSKNV